jgi:hypothetical protein
MLGWRHDMITEGHGRTFCTLRRSDNDRGQESDLDGGVEVVELALLASDSCRPFLAHVLLEVLAPPLSEIGLDGLAARGVQLLQPMHADLDVAVESMVLSLS